MLKNEVMETGYIRIIDKENNQFDFKIRLTHGTVWITVNEIADLFGVHIPAINNHIKKIFKDNYLRENEVTKEYRYTCPKHGECIRIYYNLEMIVNLCFRIQSLYTKAFRQWLFCSLDKYMQVDNAYNNFINCNSIIKEYSSFNLN